MSVITRFVVLIALLFLSGYTREANGSQQEHGHSHGHSHVHTPHMGVVTPFRSGESQVGFIELKLHDDKGDLELWLTKDEAGSKPHDLTLNTAITVTFPNLDRKTVELRVRDTEKNEDEQGCGNIRGTKTNYFIFPGDTGADASFLIGKGFAAEVVLTFTADGVTYTTNPFELKPHTH